jgi:hypothetical protein
MFTCASYDRDHCDGLKRSSFSPYESGKSCTISQTLANPPKPGMHHYWLPTCWRSGSPLASSFGRVKAKGLPYGSGPYSHTDGQIYTRRGGRGFYFEDPHGHLLEVMTVPETGS